MTGKTIFPSHSCSLLEVWTYSISKLIHTLGVSGLEPYLDKLKHKSDSFGKCENFGLVQSFNRFELERVHGSSIQFQAALRFWRPWTEVIVLKLFRSSYQIQSVFFHFSRIYYYNSHQIFNWSLWTFCNLLRRRLSW